MTDYFLDVYVHGNPKSQGSMNPSRNGRMYHPKGVLEWRAEMVHAFHQWVGTWFGGWEAVDGPVAVKAEFWLPKPKRPKFDVPATALDLDKLQRNVGDALQVAGIITNDSRIVQWDNPRKRYAHGFPGDGEVPGVRVKVRTASV